MKTEEEIKALKKEARELDDIIHGENCCFGTRDIKRYRQIVEELSKKGVCEFEIFKD